MADIASLKQKYNYHLVTPMMKQYLDAKFAHLDCFILFRMGDFYELFYEDAVSCSKILGIALSKRGKVDSLDIPMCGVPHHALDMYLPKLIKDGHKVAICEQMESPEAAKKARGYKAVVRREVVKIITPGTITDEKLLDTKIPNYLTSIVFEAEMCHIAYADLSTFDFYITSTKIDNLISELEKVSPREIIVSENITNNPSTFRLIEPYRSKLVYQVPSYFSYAKCRRGIEEFYSISTIESLGDFSNNQISTIGSILEYIRMTQKEAIPNINFPIEIVQGEHMLIDASTRRNLELVFDNSGSKKTSLFGVLDNTVTNIGSRTLYKFITNPLADHEKINARLEITNLFFNQLNITENIRTILSSVSDIERIIAKIAMAKSMPQDLVALSESLKLSDTIKSILYRHFNTTDSSLLHSIRLNLVSLQEIGDIIDNTLLIASSEDSKNTSFINPNFHPRLQELNEIINNSEVLIRRLERQYRHKTGIEGLKILSNNVLGFFVEIKPKFAAKMTDPSLIHRQSLTSCIRYTSQDLQDLENKLNNAANRKITLEQEIFDNLCKQILVNSSKIKNIARNIALIDVFCGLAINAYKFSYSKPEITNTSQFIIKDGRHPVIERILSKEIPFISNDCNLNFDNRLWLITGPNMAGKSTFLRQNALIAIMAHIGSFVPASYSKIGVIDKLFSRIGASDDLLKGQSTFMVEMIETSRILAQSTEKSFIMLDEVGRGTSTFDGVAIAWAGLEHIHDKLRCRCLFASHYHELVSVTAFLPATVNYTVKVDDSSEQILFLYKIIEGSANKSYGIHVAELAGLPKRVIRRAKELLQKLELDSKHNNKTIVRHECHNLSFASLENNTEQNAYKQKYHLLKDELDAIDPDALTPKAALEILYKIKKKALSSCS